MSSSAVIILAIIHSGRLATDKRIAPSTGGEVEEVCVCGVVDGLCVRLQIDCFNARFTVL